MKRRNLLAFLGLGVTKPAALLPAPDKVVPAPLFDALSVKPAPFYWLETKLGENTLFLPVWR